MCVFNLCWYRGAAEAQLVGYTKRSAANHMEASLRKSHDDLQFAHACSASWLIAQYSKILRGYGLHFVVFA